MGNLRQTAGKLRVAPNGLRLESANIILEELHEEDAEGVFKYASHDEVAKTSIWDAHKDIQESWDYIQNVKSRVSLEPGKIFVAWAVREKNCPDVIGTVTLTQLGDIRAQVGFVFHFDHWRRSVPLEALQKVLDWSFSSFPQFERIQARCFPQNVTSRSLMERLGMAFEGINRSMVKVRGQVADLSCYAMTRQTWHLFSAGPKGWSTREEDEGHI
jgi:ribosomal-protein-alanine N-acetyltransferase